MKVDLFKAICESRNFPGTYVVTVRHDRYGDIPYHVIPGEPLWPEVSAHVAAHPEAVQPEPDPPAVKVDPDQQLRMEIAAAKAEADYQDALKDPKWQDRKAQLVRDAK